MKIEVPEIENVSYYFESLQHDVTLPQLVPRRLSLVERGAIGAMGLIVRVSHGVLGMMRPVP